MRSATPLWDLSLPATGYGCVRIVYSIIKAHPQQLHGRSLSTLSIVASSFGYSMEMFVRYMGCQLQHCRNNTDPIDHFDSLPLLVVLNEDDDIDMSVEHRPPEDAVTTPMVRRCKSRSEHQHWPTARFLKFMAHDEDDALHLTFLRMAFPISDYGSRECGIRVYQRQRQG
ncbi:hypothetical protein ASPFODRAFT_329063 [Aspergillus luchuensis CBS 106.47]|uniref:Uncharacterized protein n=1 Tax=Aspergillus luchuensis (strain CBS 106.47) TaxID=1137211 RepID=A0A1M3T798_ASPLC|nr:hypothetical protein ASPFODRAFT_329063 [Aspergillus luchuensis CBS 106.47]